MGERAPGVPAAEILPHRAPLPFAEIGAPPPPGDIFQVGVVQTPAFRMHAMSVGLARAFRVTRAGWFPFRPPRRLATGTPELELIAHRDMGRRLLNVGRHDP